MMFEKERSYITDAADKAVRRKGATVGLGLRCSSEARKHVERPRGSIWGVQVGRTLPLPERGGCP